LLLMVLVPTAFLAVLSGAGVAEGCADMETGTAVGCAGADEAAIGGTNCGCGCDCGC
jgi:hypothetical protein